VKSCKKIDVILDSLFMTKDQYLNNIIRYGFHHIRNVDHIKHYLTNDATQPLVNGVSNTTSDLL